MSRSRKLVAGVDGCRAGWVAVIGPAAGPIADSIDGPLWIAMAGSLAELTGRFPSVERWAIDIPIGLSDSGPRACDQAARKRLGRRGSSVFPAPPTAVIDAKDYPEACRLAARATGKKISKQTWFITPKIHETRELLAGKPALAKRSFETHPELCFAELAGGPLPEAKKTSEGGRHRRRLLVERFSTETIDALIFQTESTRGVAVDDTLDATACWIAAARDLVGESQRLPEESIRDGSGLEIAIRW